MQKDFFSFLCASFFLNKDLKLYVLVLRVHVLPRPIEIFDRKKNMHFRCKNMKHRELQIQIVALSRGGHLLIGYFLSQRNNGIMRSYFHNSAIQFCKGYAYSFANSIKCVYIPRLRGDKKIVVFFFLLQWGKNEQVLRENSGFHK